MTISVPNEYGWVVIAAALQGIQCIAFGLFFVMPLRAKYFTKEFFETKFNMKDRYPDSGYPDMGNGRYAAKLTDEQWVDFNNAQRAHGNYVEAITPVMSTTLLCGLFYVRFAALCGFVHVLGRLMYAIGYRRAGSRGRYIALPLTILSYAGLFFATIYGAFHTAGGVPGLLALLKF